MPDAGRLTDPADSSRIASIFRLYGPLISQAFVRRPASSALHGDGCLHNLGMTIDLENPAPPADLWTRARDDYLNGASAPVVAERYGLTLRTVRRRAAVEGWRRADGAVPPFDDPPPWNRGALSREDAIEVFPELAEVEQAVTHDRFLLLFDPDQKYLRRFAFRRAAEAAALSRPAEAVVWMRLVQSLERTGERIDAEARPFREQNYLRASFLRRFDEDLGPDPAHDEA